MLCLPEKEGFFSIWIIASKLHLQRIKVDTCREGGGALVLSDSVNHSLVYISKLYRYTNTLVNGGTPYLYLMGVGTLVDHVDLNTVYCFTATSVMRRRA